MDNKTITIQTNTEKKGKLDQRALTCQILEFEKEKQRIYVLDDTKRDLRRKNFVISEGCRVIDDKICFPIQKVIFSGIPIRYHLVVYTDRTI